MALRSGEHGVVVELIAHRAGNAPDSIAPASLVADMVEADVHRFHGRLEVRHAKVFWPSRRQWERWWIDWAPERPPSLRAILRTPPVDMPLWLDLKGFTQGFAADVVARLPATRRVTVSSRNWWTLRPVRRSDIRTMRSVGSRWQLWAVLGIRRWSPGDGIAIDERFLSPSRLRRLLRITPTVVAWGVTESDRAEELVAAGIGGLILDDLGLIAEIRSRRVEPSVSGTVGAPRDGD